MNQLEEMRAQLPEATENGVALVALPDLAALLAVAEAAERYVAEKENPAPDMLMRRIEFERLAAALAPLRRRTVGEVVTLRWCQSCGARATRKLPDGSWWCVPCDDAAERLGYDQEEENRG